MILIKNKQRTIKIDVEQLEKDAQAILNSLKYDDYDLGILLCSDAAMRTYNRDFRNKDKATDVLSFPYHPQLRAGERIKPVSPEDKNLGDIIIAPKYVLKDLPRWEQSFEDRMKVLLVHGICHLLGYDHEKDEEYKVMHRREKSLLKIIS